MMATVQRGDWRSLVLAFSAAAVVLVAGGIWLYRAEADRIHREQHEAVAAVGLLKSEEIAQWRRERIDDAEVAARVPTFAEVLPALIRGTASAAQREVVRGFLASVLQTEGYTDGLLVALDGRRLESVPDTAVRSDSATRVAIREAARMRRGVLSDLFPGAADTVYIDAVAIVRDARGLPMGAVVLRNDVRTYLYPLIARWPTPSKSAETVLVERQGNEVVSLSDLRFEPRTALRWRRPLTLGQFPAVQAVLGTRGSVEGVDYRGVQVLADLRAIPDSPWLMVAKVDAGELLAEARYRAGAIALVVGSLVLLAAMITAYAYRRRQAGVYQGLYESERGQRLAQEQYRTTLHSIGDAVVTTTVAGRVRGMNPAAEQMTGWKEAEAGGRPLADVVRLRAERTRLEIDLGLDAVLREGRLVQLGAQGILIARDGTERPVADSAAPILDDHGAVAGYVIVLRDQTAERRARADLLLSLERFQMANRATFDVIWDYDPRADTIWRNDNFRERFGYEPEEVETGLESWSARVHPDDRERVRRGLDAALASAATAWSAAYRFRRRDGTYALVEDRANILRDADHRAVRVIGAMQDVTELRRTEAGFRRLNRVYAVQSEINQAIVRIRDQQVLFERACQIAVERGGMRMAWVGVLDAATREIRVAASAGVTDGYLRNVNVLVDDPVRGRGPTGTAMREGRRDVCNDVAHDPRMAPWRESALALGYRASAAFPLVVNGSTRGAFTLYADEPGFFDRDELALLDDLAASIGFAMELAEQESARRQLEAQFLQAQKMETVGRLAGGIAHDFNNLLTVINGVTGVAMERGTGDEQLRRDLGEVKDAGERAAALTRQLLAFSRQQMLKPDVIDLNALLGRMQPMLRRLLPESVALVVSPGAGLGHVRADPGQLEQVVLNLAVNASDAMPQGGTLTIETQNAELDEGYAASHPSVRPGAYVMLAMTDTGVGMDEATRQRIFEPFFTTKEAGKGTGLGLATVYGIVKQSDGSIWVYSEPGRGSTFKIYLPRVVAPAPAPGASASPRREAMRRGTETILVVEDDPGVRRLAERILTGAGYTVLTAVDGGVALELLRGHAGPIHLVLSDVVLPGIGGRELAAQVAAVHPRVRVLLTSGYTDDALLRSAVTDAATQFLGKPYTAAELTRRVREVLDAPGAPGTPAP
ncbi:MAG: PAS domain S-box protein [Gemmatimonadota bacterium]|nr:PAS domain S-box protein [Gemmatimonadota bacterium]